MRIWWAVGLLFLVTPAGAQPTVDACPVFPADNIWNVPVDTLPLDANSSAYVNSIGAATTLHPDFGAALWQGGPIGIPFVSTSGTQAKVAIHYQAYGDQSDPGPFPVPATAPIEGGAASEGDRHVLVVDRGACRLYELYRAFPLADGSWEADSGAAYDLRSHALRPAGWTSADAAGLPIFPGLARYEEVAAGEIRHALRFTAPKTRRAYLWPARHFASSSSSASLPAMGQRFRLKAGVEIAAFSPQLQVILRALKRYGMILADNGSPWYISGAPSPGWDDDALVSELRRLKGSDFEAVDVSSLFLTGDSGQAAVEAAPPPASLIVTTPNGGEEWLIGQTFKVFWAALGLTGKIKIELSRDGGVTWSSLAKATLNDGKQGFKVTGPATTRARVRLTSVAQPQLTDASNGDFRIR
jgi:hypothetical protein